MEPLLMPDAPAPRRRLLLGLLDAAMAEAGITTPRRQAAFVAQIGHETAGLRFWREVWGPTAAQRRYEPPSPTARRLGNTQPGDGYRFRGRGPLQLTGRANYARLGAALGVDLLAEPDRAAEPELGFRLAARFWQDAGLNALADQTQRPGDAAFQAITQRINGAQVGAAERAVWHQRAWAWFGVDSGQEGVVEGAPTPAPRGRRGARGRTAAASPTAALPATRAGRATSGDTPPAGQRTAAADAAPATPPRQTTRRRLDARADTLDFRDRMFEPTLVDVPATWPLSEYLAYDLPVLDQGQEGACTGFGLATVVHYLLARRGAATAGERVSPAMLYALARRYDEWPGEQYEGSSARGAMKGWHKHGANAEAVWQAVWQAAGGAEDTAGGRRRRRPAAGSTALHWTPEQARDARRRPLGAYYRVNHRDLIAMHAALAEVGVLYATAVVHEGWDAVGPDGEIPFHAGATGGHAFAIVAYDDVGFWLQNSWGPEWGLRGFARIRYADWLHNGTDVWVARLGVPLAEDPEEALRAPDAPPAEAQSASAWTDWLRPHVVSIGAEGRLRSDGAFGTSRAGLKAQFDALHARLVEWTEPRLMLWAHGGLVSEAQAVQRVADWRGPLMAQQVFPLALVWHSDLLSTLGNVLQQAVRERRSADPLDGLKDFLLDRIDDMLEPLARQLLGKLAWDAMKANARGCAKPGHGGALVVAELARLKQRLPKLEIHWMGHSAGSIVLGPLLQAMSARRLRVASLTLLAPACTVRDFAAWYGPALEKGTIEKLALYTLTDAAERDDHVARLYNKSILYLVAHALEARLRVPGDPVHRGEALLGLRKFSDPAHPDHDPRLLQALQRWAVEQVVAPNDLPAGNTGASKATRHGDFDDDPRTLLGVLSRITGRPVVAGARPLEQPMGGPPRWEVAVTPSARGEGGPAAAGAQPRSVPVRSSEAAEARARRRVALDQATRWVKLPDAR